MATDAIPTTQELLDDVKRAIQAVILQQSYTLTTSTGGRSVTRANLAELRRMRYELETELDREQRGGIGVQYVC